MGPHERRVVVIVLKYFNRSVDQLLKFRYLWIGCMFCRISSLRCNGETHVKAMLKLRISKRDECPC